MLTTRPPNPLSNDSVSSELFRQARSSPSPRDRKGLPTQFNCPTRDVQEGSKVGDYKCLLTRTAMTLTVLQKRKLSPLNIYL
jgi:hypothetical protein